MPSDVRKQLIGLFLFWALAIFAAIEALGADWYWRPYAGATTGDGRSYDTAWRGPMATRWAQMQAGDRLLICGAHGPDTATQLTPGIDGITLTGACSQAAGSMTLTGVGEAIVLRDRRDVRVEDLRISNCWAGITVERGGGHRFTRLQVADCRGYGVRAQLGDSTDIVLLDSTLERVGNGVYLVGAQHSGWTVSGVRIADVSGTKDAHGIGVQSCVGCELSHNWIERANSGITLWRISLGQMRDVRVHDNIIRDLRGVAGSTGLNRGVEVTSANCVAPLTVGVVVEDNRFSNIADAAVYVKVAPPQDARESAVIVTGNFSDGPGLLWTALRLQEAARTTPWFSVFNNHWGPARNFVWTPSC